MFCPIRLRLDSLNLVNRYRIPVKSIRKERQWIICRALIVSSGNLLSLIYGVLILMTVNWCQKRCSAFGNNSLEKAYNTGVCIIIIASFGCVSLFIKSNFRQFTDSFLNLFETNNHNTREIIRIKRAPGDSPNSFYHSCIYYLRKRCQQLKRWFRYSPILTVNLFLIISVIPVEVLVIIKCILYLMGTYLKLDSHDWLLSTTTVAVLCLQVLYISVLLSQLCVLIYIYDLIDTSLDKHSLKCINRLKTNRELQKSLSPGFGRRIQNQMRIHATREKNIRFHQFLENKGYLSAKTDISPMEKLRTISKASTVKASDAETPEPAQPSTRITIHL